MLYDLPETMLYTDAELDFQFMGTLFPSREEMQMGTTTSLTRKLDVVLKNEKKKCFVEKLAECDVGVPSPSPSLQFISMLRRCPNHACSAL